MKKFLKKIALFIGCLITVSVIISLALDKIVNDEGNFKIPANKTVLVFGHSQAACAYNDSLIENFGNYEKGMTIIRGYRS